jgi:quercetin dioxygenase-like cupin family protein
MAEYQQILQLSDMPWEQGISPTIWQKPIWTRSDSNSHAQAMLVKMAPGGTSPAHRHPHPQIFYVISGTGIVRLDGVEHPLKPGSVVRVLGGELHDFVNTGTEELVMIEMQIFDIKIDLKKVLEKAQQKR